MVTQVPVMPQAVLEIVEKVLIAVAEHGDGAYTLTWQRRGCTIYKLGTEGAKPCGEPFPANLSKFMLTAHKLGLTDRLSTLSAEARSGDLYLAAVDVIASGMGLKPDEILQKVTLAPRPTTVDLFPFVFGEGFLEVWGMVESEAKLGWSPNGGMALHINLTGKFVTFLHNPLSTVEDTHQLAAFLGLEKEETGDSSLRWIRVNKDPGFPG